jgi:hypothetical protein
MKSFTNLIHKIRSSNIPAHSVFFHIPMETPLIIECNTSESDKIMSGTGNLQSCAFVAAKLVKNDKTYLGFVHHDGSEKSIENMQILAQFLKNLAGSAESDILITRAQNIEANLAGGELAEQAKFVRENAAEIFRNAGFNDIPTTKVLGSSRILYKTDKNETDGIKIIEPYQKASSLFPEYFMDKKLQDDSHEFYDDIYLKEDIKSHRRNFWNEFSDAKSFDKQRDILGEYSLKYFLKENQIAKQGEINRS